jgi:hypothetical protein
MYWRVILEHYTTLDAADDLSIDDIELMCIAADAWHSAAPQPKI